MVIAVTVINPTVIISTCLLQSMAVFRTNTDGVHKESIACFGDVVPCSAAHDNFSIKLV